MKNMVLLIDSNVIIDYVAEREPQYPIAKNVMKACQTNEVNGYIAFHTLPTIWHIMRKHNVEDRRDILLKIMEYLTVASVSHKTAIEALQESSFPDFEDCLQEKCALSVNADYIVTENIKDFRTSKIPAVTALDMLKILYDNGR